MMRERNLDATQLNLDAKMYVSTCLRNQFTAYFTILTDFRCLCGLFSWTFQKANISTSVLGPSNYLDLDSVGGIFHHKPAHERKISEMLAHEKI